MSDTPRTEAKVNRQKCWSDDLITIDANFACQLERELNAATSEIERLRKANLQLREGAEEQKQRIKRLEGELESTKLDRDSWSNQSDEFAKTAADLIIHIQRLEEAAQRVDDAAHSIQDWSETVLGDALDELNKAKEAKP